MRVLVTPLRSRTWDTSYRTKDGDGGRACPRTSASSRHFTWRNTLKTPMTLLVFLTLLAPCRAAVDYSGWAHSGSMVILTTPEGADLPAAASVEGFPLLVRLHKDFFDFGQAGAGGADLRFSAAGERLAYQIEEWDAAKGVASIWVRIPKITGDARQEMKLHWGRADARSESDGKAVFNGTNGYLSVWHMGDDNRDEVGTLKAVDTGTTATAGVVGAARHFPGGKGIFCGDKIPDYPTGSGPHTTEAWFRADRPNGAVIGWGNEQAQGKVVMHYRSPPRVRMDCYFSGADVGSRTPLAAKEWVHVVHTYEKGDSRLYLNGRLDGESRAPGAPLAVRSPARLWIGGWYDNYDFIGDIDEPRVSKVVRSADWVRLQYENQKPLQTLVGPLVRPGRAFSVSPAEVEVAEGRNVTLTAQAGGAQKVYWIVERDGKEAVAAVDRFAFTFEGGQGGRRSGTDDPAEGGLPGRREDHRRPRHDPRGHPRTGRRVTGAPHVGRQGDHRGRPAGHEPRRPAVQRRGPAEHLLGGIRFGSQQGACPGQIAPHASPEQWHARRHGRHRQRR